MIRTKGRVGAERSYHVVAFGIRCIGPVVIATVMASCSGGGGGGGNGLKDNPSVSYLEQAEEPSLPAAAGDWSNSQEYLNSTGLAQLKAAEGYARRTGGLPGGQGVRIAIIDSGIDLTHVDLGNLAAQSWSAGGEELVGDPHGTFVAGIAGASRTQTADANDMHGLAYRATLVNFQTARPSVTAANGGVSFSTSDLVTAINRASGFTSGSAAVESDILNLSLGSFSSNDNTFASLRTAMRNAADENKIMVIATGNEGLDPDPTRKLQPIYPAAYVDDVGIAGFAIAVGNLTSGNQAAASSNLCGDTKNYCLFAPGTNIRSTLNGGGYGIGSGTSFAAPYVSGAAVVVKAAFPGISSEDVVDRLLLTANDLGDPGVDDTFGHGLLDLEAAMAPVGPLGLPIGPSVDDASITVATSSLDLGPAWSIGDDGRMLLENAVGFDRMGFPFPIDLGDRVVPAGRESGLRHFIGAPSTSSARASLLHGSLAVSMVDPADGWMLTDNHDSKGADDKDARSQVPHLTFDAWSDDHIALFASLYGSTDTRLGLRHALTDLGLDGFQSDRLLAPFDRLSGRMSGGGLTWAAHEGFEIAFSAFANLADDQAKNRAVQKVEIAKSLTSHVELRLGLGLLQEEDGFLGAHASGAFGEDLDSRSQIADLSLIASVTEQIDWFGSYSRGHSSIDSRHGGLLSDWSSAHAEAFATGVSISDLAVDNDSLSLIVGQPFRGDHAKATLTVPVGRTPDGRVVTERQRVDLEPSSREISSEMIYRRSFGPGKAQEIRAGGFARFNPNHNADQPPEFGIGLRYRWTF